MKMSLLCTLTFGALPGCAGPDLSSYQAPHIIENNRGGYIHEALLERDKLRRWGGRVEIHGVCNSSCVIFTALPNACIARDLQIGFHRSSVNIGSLIGNAQLSEHFRGGIKAQYDAVWSQLPEGQSHTISATEYVALDPATHICD